MNSSLTRLRLSLTGCLCMCCLLLQATAYAQSYAQDKQLAGTNYPNKFVNSEEDREQEIAVKSLRVGDRVPDMVFSMVNFKHPTARISDFKGKLVLLDFWATWCSSCVYNFPKMDSLQEKYHDRLQVLLVNSRRTRDDTRMVKMFFEKWSSRKGNKLGLPSAVNDSIAELTFEHLSIPHYVWIDSNRMVLAITSADEVTEPNIKSVINGGTLRLQEKQDRWYNVDEPMFLAGNGGEGGTMLYRSLLTGYSNGVGGASGWNRNTGNIVSKIFSTNVSILMLYQQAHPEAYDLPPNRIVLNVSEPQKYHNYGDWNKDGWKFDNLYCYELTIPPTTPDRIHEIMQDDLYRYFGVRARMEKRKLKCLVLQSRNTIYRAISRGGDPESTLQENDAAPKYIRNLPLVNLVNRLNQVLMIPVIDETQISQNLDITLPPDLTDIEAIRKALDKIGLVLAEEERELDMFVIGY